jgi:hypothetical protein
MAMWMSGDAARGQGKGDRSALSIGQGMDLAMDLACRAAPRDPDRFRPSPPFVVWAERCAFTCVLSKDGSSGTGPAAAILSNMRCQTPRRDQRVKRS